MRANIGAIRSGLVSMCSDNRVENGQELTQEKTHSTPTL